MLSVGGMRTFFHKFGNGCALALLGVFALSLVIGFSGNQLGGRAARSNSNTAADTVIATVNGQPVTEADFRDMVAQLQARSGSSAPGRQFAEMQGTAMMALVQRAIIEQEAQKRNARPLDADIDRTIDQNKAAVAQRMNKSKLTDQEWESFLESNRGISRPIIASKSPKSLVPLGLVNSLKSQQKVTEEEARNQTAKARLTMVTIPYADPGMPTPPKGSKPLTEAEAKQKATDLLAKVKAGADIAAVARANGSKGALGGKDGDTNFVQEYPSNTQGGLSFDLNTLYGKDFAEAVHKLDKGQLTDVIQTTGLFGKGFAFAKLTDRKNDLPKDFNPKLAMNTLAEQRAQEAAQKLIKDQTKVANVDIKRSRQKAYYDFVKQELAAQEATQSAMSGGPITPPPSKAETDAQQAVIDKEFEDMLKRHPEDTTAAIMVAESLKTHKMLQPGTQDRLITLDETIVKNTDDPDKHFELADLYRQKKDYDKAKAQYDRVAKLLSYNTPYDVQTMQAAAEQHHKLETGYRSINQSAEADKEKAAYDDLQKKIAEENIKQKMQQRSQPPAAPFGGAPMTPTPAPSGTPGSTRTMGTMGTTGTGTRGANGASKATGKADSGLKLTPAPGSSSVPLPTAPGAPTTAPGTSP